MKILENGVLRDATEAELQQQEIDLTAVQENAPIYARQARDRLLAETDWTQGADVPSIIKDSYAIYRQALRDVPSQEGFPHNIIWPTKPE
jgi:hypothetical protein